MIIKPETSQDLKTIRVVADRLLRLKHGWAQGLVIQGDLRKENYPYEELWADKRGPRIGQVTTEDGMWFDGVELRAHSANIEVVKYVWHPGRNEDRKSPSTLRQQPAEELARAILDLGARAVNYIP